MPGLNQTPSESLYNAPLNERVQIWVCILMGRRGTGVGVGVRFAGMFRGYVSGNYVSGLCFGVCYGVCFAGVQPVCPSLT